jgi:hypothetical protein
MSHEALVSYTSSHIQTSQQAKWLPTRTSASHTTNQPRAHSPAHPPSRIDSRHLGTLPRQSRRTSPGRHHVLPTRSSDPCQQQSTDIHNNLRLPSTDRSSTTSTLLQRTRYSTCFAPKQTNHINHGQPHRYQHRNLRLSLSTRAK